MSKKKPRIQRVELADSGLALFCPFCGVQATRSAKEWDQEWVQVGRDPCPHVLFIAHDMEFVYRAKRFDQLMQIEGVEGDDLDFPNENGIDGFTDATPIEGAVKFASYEGPPSLYGSYVGFAPTDED
jgi:hypothetical protein